jgi:hypothetical protein
VFGLQGFWWRRYRFWVRLPAELAGALVIGLAVTEWFPGVRAGVLGAAVTAVFTATVFSVQTQWHQRSEMSRSLPGALAIALSKGGFPFAREVSDAIAAGVQGRQRLTPVQIVVRRLVLSWQPASSP